MENNQEKPKPKALSLKVKTLEKKTAPKAAMESGNPVIGYT